MSFFGLFGSKPESKPEPSESSELFASTTFASPSPSTSTSSSTAGPSAPAAPITAPTALDTFSSASAFDPRKLHPLAGLGDNIDFLTLEEGRPAETGEAHVLPSRGWTDDLCVGTGTTYLSGLAVGGMWGFKEGFSRPLGNTPSFKLRLNSILNGCTRRGSFMGNSLGVLGMSILKRESEWDSDMQRSSTTLPTRQ